jgi:NAD(P)-dependent dehydrogenase (short-subunit alcohol dehydrogenase family)
MTRTVVVVGVGRGLGAAVARRFAAEGCAVGLVARSASVVSDLADDIERETPGDALAVPADVTDPGAVTAGFDRVRDAFGRIDTLASTLYADSGGGDGVPSVDALRGTTAVELDGVLRCLNEALPDLRAADGAAVVVTGSASAVTGRESDPARAAARAGRRALLQSLASDLAADDVHVAHVVVDGWLDTPALREAYPDRDEHWIAPAAVADEFWHLATQRPDAWTFELDVRASGDDHAV